MGIGLRAVADTAYTERYLGLATPDDNIAGYNVSFSVKRRSHRTN